MGLFFNYDRPGRGVDKDAPKKWGIFLYFELLWRNFSKILLTNILYVLTGLPVTAVYFVVFLYFSSVLFPENAVDAVSRLVVILSVLFTILWGTGPMSCGLTYVLRSFARDEPVWPTSDMFQKAKENFKQGLAMLLIDIVVLVTGGIALISYMNMARGGNLFYLFLMMLVAVVMVFYTVMHFYLYELAVTFDNKLTNIYKNAALLSMGTLPFCIGLAAVIVVLTSFVFGFLTGVGMIFVSLVCWVCFMRFIIDFYTARLIKRKLIGQGESDE